ncbi:ATP-binding protein, partial [Anoxybacillus sp. KU2-6(11)]|uniref:ATP-binding protein n=1 Tax=Anoxybacillus sp. KU2-6(11) TaxID=1535751 RepID=UPI001E356186
EKALFFFEPFMTTKSSGTGLGLTIVKRIIENHGGTIALHDSSEKGTTFVISLPIGR